MVYKSDPLGPPAAKVKNYRMFHDDSMRSFFRRLAFTPDGSLLLVPEHHYSSLYICLSQYSKVDLCVQLGNSKLKELFEERYGCSCHEDLSEIRLTLRGMEKSLPPSSPSRQPISTDLLLHLIIALRQGCFNPFDDIVMETLCLIAFFGFLRCSEFSTPSTSSFPALGLKRSDLSQIPGNHFILHIRSSKTDQLSQAPPPLALGTAPPPLALGTAPPPLALGTAPPPLALGTAPPPLALGTAPPPLALGTAPPPLALGTAPPSLAVGMAAPPPLALGMASPPPLALSTAPPPLALGTAPPPLALRMAAPPPLALRTIAPSSGSDVCQ
ncbi:UNVERIFIED_CONTAM: hypothetical protein FKN15_068325 [Acipenser sinensis]